MPCSKSDVQCQTPLFRRYSTRFMVASTFQIQPHVWPLSIDTKVLERSMEENNRVFRYSSPMCGLRRHIFRHMKCLSTEDIFVTFTQLDFLNNYSRLLHRCASSQSLAGGCDLGLWGEGVWFLAARLLISMLIFLRIHTHWNNGSNHLQGFW